MSLEILTPAQWQTQAWKNGGGITHEIWKQEENSGLSVRLSVAEVASDGAFSRFPGIDRHIHLLEGNGFRLQRENGEVLSVDYRDRCLPFSGDEPLHCTLIEGPVKDFNLMLDRGHWWVEVSDLFLFERAFTTAAADLTLLFVLAGEWRVAGGAQPLGRYHTLVAQGANALSLQSVGATPAHAILMRLDRR